MLKIKEIRKAKGLTQQVVADKLSLFRPTYARYENEEHQMPYDLLIAVADYFDVSLDYLFGRSESEQAATITLTDEEKKLLSAFNALIPSMQDFVLDMVERVVAQPQNIKRA